MSLTRSLELQKTRPSSSRLDGLIPAIIGSLLGLIASSVCGALGSLLGYSFLGSLLGLFTFARLGRNWALREAYQGRWSEAKLIRTCLESFLWTGLGISLALTCQSLLLLQLSLALGLLMPSFVARWL